MKGLKHTLHDVSKNGAYPVGLLQIQECLPGASRLSESDSFTVAVWKMTGTNMAAALSMNTACMNLSTLNLQADNNQYFGRFADCRLLLRLSSLLRPKDHLALKGRGPVEDCRSALSRPPLKDVM